MNDIEEDLKPNIKPEQISTLNSIPDEPGPSKSGLGLNSTSIEIDNLLHKEADLNQELNSNLKNEDHKKINPKLDSLANLTCSICLGSPSPLVVTQCGHVACGGCLTASLVSQVDAFGLPMGGQNSGKCPVCRTVLGGGWGTSMRGAILKMGPGQSSSS
ncbi:hypothetical protein CROQUDRAFT_104427 [Cronartium quercuum f. sp. fusiforme G11]|uniref:RING-type domain-containing protein n=1 Tax=Cronartium quercuum f. sp. fusiforme G11 TaxID=708437 RepID=A0A9P6N765_9BASI|nr:hypothetical protein CROQUDRAFT_611194 [Cronartium quercuum f. sp. fusiforme G11]KAG0150327.1 hypothetical protein CROQUDRAFT_104427 [Cronartium quercuum f. sp. fusiforme G11]